MIDGVLVLSEDFVLLSSVEVLLKSRESKSNKQHNIILGFTEMLKLALSRKSTYANYTGHPSRLGTNDCTAPETTILYLYLKDASQGWRATL